MYKILIFFPKLTYFIVIELKLWLKLLLFAYKPKIQYGHLNEFFIRSILVLAVILVCSQFFILLNRRRTFFFANYEKVVLYPSALHSVYLCRSYVLGSDL